MVNIHYGADYAKRPSGCKKCKQQFEKGNLRVAKFSPNTFSNHPESSEMKQYYHPECIFETFSRARAGTKVIESAGDVEGWSDLADDDKKKMLDLIAEREKKMEAKKGGSKKKAARPKTKQATITDFVVSDSKSKESAESSDDSYGKLDQSNASSTTPTVEGWSDLTDVDKKEILGLIAERKKKAEAKKGAPKRKAARPKTKQVAITDFVVSDSKSKESDDSSDGSYSKRDLSAAADADDTDDNLSDEDNDDDDDDDVKSNASEQSSDLKPPPSKKTKRECRYGASCYQKNPVHREQYSHPDDDGGEDEEFLANHSVFLSADIPNRRKLARYIAFYGGDLIELKQATDPERDDHDVIFVLNGGDDKVAAHVPVTKHGNTVTVDWLTDCIKQGKLLNVKKYLL